MLTTRSMARALACLCWIATIGVLFPADAAPADAKIFAVQWATSAQLHPGSMVEATVLTSNDIGYVELHVRTWSINFEKTAPGMFSLHYRVPLLPPVALGNWNIDLIAHSTAGIAVKRVYHVSYHYF
jgi:hypothetical protein